MGMYMAKLYAWCVLPSGVNCLINPLALRYPHGFPDGFPLDGIDWFDHGKQDGASEKGWCNRDTVYPLVN